MQFYDLNTKLTIDLVSDPLSPEVRNASGKSTVNWDGNAVDRVYSEGRGDDTIYGNAAANGITTHGGVDQVFAGAGSDSINVADGAGGDRVNCGNDAVPDTVVSDTGDVTSANCSF